MMHSNLDILRSKEEDLVIHKIGENVLMDVLLTNEDIMSSKQFEKICDASIDCTQTHFSNGGFDFRFYVSKSNQDEPDYVCCTNSLFSLALQKVWNKFFYIAGAMAKSDGVITKDEIDLVTRYIKTQVESRKQQEQCKNAFNRGKNHKGSLVGVAEELLACTKEIQESMETLNQDWYEPFRKEVFAFSL